MAFIQKPNKKQQTESQKIKEELLQNILARVKNDILVNNGEYTYSQFNHSIPYYGYDFRPYYSNRFNQSLLISDIEKIKKQLQKEGFKIEYITVKTVNYRTNFFGVTKKTQNVEKYIKVSI